ncbi:MAG: DUF1211 domain-containing protein [Candidatus Nomurabacteria bacterium]|jgi:uncharacterized membrane protein|nr:DUF1211 domain-containing protein [Candidatus Nomurabacteria bacterium]
MNKSRLESFTDGVIVIAMTIMVVSIAAPTGAEWTDLWGLRYKFLVYALSFFTLAVYWKNHHHLLQKVKNISHTSLWLNIALLFFLTLFTFTTAWIDEYITELVPALTYGTVMLAANLSFILLSLSLERLNNLPSNVVLYTTTLILNIGGLALGFICPPLVLACCVALLVIWSVPRGYSGS